MTRKAMPISSEMGWSSVDRILVRGYDLCDDIIGKLNLGDMAYLEITGRLPSEAESTMFNAILVTLVEHGLTPMAIAARLTYLGAPESLQSAVAAGLCGMGTTFAGTAEGAARVLHETLADNPEQSIEVMSDDIVSRYRSAKTSIPGIGHNLHKPQDPRATRLFKVAEEHGFSGRYVKLMKGIADAATRQFGKDLPVNATGAIGALCCELGISWKAARGIAVMGRSVGLVGHLVEEQGNPIAKEVWLRTEEEAHDNAQHEEESAP